ncbi:lysophospholipid acyltransferase family protein [Wenzhouxiangella sp. EGI_FJ10409]|uniref:lysophospholipid acyltransferase family protein n=1 Tax=Wenzhouxiangella sp. EGI_FJ10409 TaxID=3243767 RepID=UPI0035D874EC
MRGIMFRRVILPRIVYAVYRGWSATWRLRRREPPAMLERMHKGQPFVVAMWHGDEFGLICFSRFYHLATMTSWSKDGELMDYVLRRLGFETARGSSSRGGSSALRGLLRLARRGWSPVITVDGPRGPVHKAKPGVLELARMTGLPVFPCAMACTRHLPLHRSWDQAKLPTPFAKVLIYWGDPIIVDRETDARSPAMTQRLEDAINRCSREARATLAAGD